MPTDVNQPAKAIVDIATGTKQVPDPDEGKDPRRGRPQTQGRL